MVVKYSSRFWGTEWLSYLVWSLYLFLVAAKSLTFILLFNSELCHDYKLMMHNNCINCATSLAWCRVHFLHDLSKICRLCNQKSTRWNAPSSFCVNCLSVAHLVYLPVFIVTGNAYCWLWLKRPSISCRDLVYECLIYRNSSPTSRIVHSYPFSHSLSADYNDCVCSLQILLMYGVQRNTVEHVVNLQYCLQIPWAIDHHAILRMNLQHSESSALPGYSCLLNWKLTPLQ